MIDQEQNRWDYLRRGLDPEHQRAFEAVFQRAQRQASAAGDQGAPDPFEAILLTVLVELEAELQRVLARVAWLETDVEHGKPNPRRGRHPFEEPFPLQGDEARNGNDEGDEEEAEAEIEEEQVQEI